MKAFATLGAVLLPFIASTATGIELDPTDEASIKAAARTYAYGLMELYRGNATGTMPENIGIWGKPYYWWEGGKKFLYSTSERPHIGGQKFLDCGTQQRSHLTLCRCSMGRHDRV